MAGFIGNVKCSVFDVNFENALIAQQGLGWPASIHIAKGNEALMKLSKALENYDSCTVVPPSGIKFDVSSPPSSRYDKWGDFCGIRVRNVTSQDVGRWRLTSIKDSQSRTGWVEVYVLEDKSSYTPPPLSLLDGETQTTVDLSSTENTYCVVAKPFSESSLVPGHCSVTLDRTTRAVQGNWQINLGLPGRVAELQTNLHVTVETERLDVGYIHDATNKLHLYCNILHTTKNITFCRFQRTSSSYGFNVIDGLSDGTHSYYGEGFALKQCGMTIERPTVEDYGTWRCSVGVNMFVGTEIRQQPTMQALISVPQNTYSHQNPENTQTTIFVQENSQFTVTCNAKISLSYCWFQHPNGTQFTPVSLSGTEQIFWYAGESLDVGDCSITFKYAINTDGGEWTCHMGPKNSLGVELTDKVQVRVTGPLAANEKEIGVNIGSNATLYCHTANGRRPLKYCRFLSPTYMGMNMDSSIQENNAILNRYYFTPERDINFGDCSLNIISVQEEDIGEWTCGAVVDNEILESRDIIKIYLSETRLPQFRAGMIGMSVGLSVLVVVLIGYVSHKRAWLQWICAKNTTETMRLQELSLNSH
ncbi:unnamed protein product, partial [Brenthis ino]